MEHYKILVLLAELASKNGNIYNITDYVFGFIPFKNGKNKVQEIGDNFFNIAHWLLDEAEANNK